MSELLVSDFYRFTANQGVQCVSQEGIKLKDPSGYNMGEILLLKIISPPCSSPFANPLYLPTRLSPHIF